MVTPVDGGAVTTAAAAAAESVAEAAVEAG